MINIRKVSNNLWVVSLRHLLDTTEHQHKVLRTLASSVGGPRSGVFGTPYTHYRFLSFDDVAKAIKASRLDK